MAETRSPLRFADELAEFDPSAWPSRKGRGQAETGKPTTPRRRRTGRNAQFNIKAKPETIEQFCSIADSQELTLAETFEVALALLQEKYAV